MPEGDSIFRAARTLHRALAGKVVTRFDTAYAPLARVHDDTPITGRTIEAVEARGKHLVMRFSGNLALRTHMPKLHAVVITVDTTTGQATAIERISLTRAALEEM